MTGRRGTLQERFERYYTPEPNSGCWLWLGGALRGGYGQMHSKDIRLRRAHVASFFIHYGWVPENLDIRHSCDVRSCVNPDHLTWGTRKENMEDARVRGRLMHGSGHYATKLTEQIVIEIRTDPRKYKVIAEHFGTTEATVTQIKLRRTWKHVV
jgi:hypothetical protein